jgi:hypothetical protein
MTMSISSRLWAASERAATAVPWRRLIIEKPHSACQRCP